MPDIVVIGGGIAGMSAAAELASHADVVLVEREAVLAYHTTGRSAAMFFESYGSHASRPLTRASASFFVAPPQGVVDGSLLGPRNALYVARSDQREVLEASLAADTDGDFERVTPTEIMTIQPCMRPGYAASGLLDRRAMDIDVAGTHQAFVRTFRARGGHIDTSAPVVALDRAQSGWIVSTAGTTISTDLVVNAAGAWGDEVAAMAGIDPIDLTPMRRTAFMVTGDVDLSHTALVADVEMLFYFKPDGEQMLCSLAEEIPEEPRDARPREIDIALAIERINAATTLDIRHVRSSWTGQRTFAPDRAPVIGFEPQVDGFFWLVGQGGVGIQSAPAAARYSAGMIFDGEPPPDIMAENVQIDLLAPDRFRS